MRRRNGWTLIELVVVIAIVAVVLAMALAAILQARQAANGMTCLNNLRQLGHAVLSYEEAVGSLPPYSTGQLGTTVEGSWWIHLMPYAGEENFHQKIMKVAQPSPSGPGTLATTTSGLDGIKEARFSVLQCPSDPSVSYLPAKLGTTNYLANWYLLGDGNWGCYTPPRKFKEVTDGLSNTVLFAEGYASCDGIPRVALVACCLHNFGITWEGKPSDDPSYLPEDYTMFQVAPQVKGPGGCDKWRTQTPHAAMPVALADSSARLIQASINPILWKQLLKPADGKPISGDW